MRPGASSFISPLPPSPSVISSQSVSLLAAIFLTCEHESLFWIRGAALVALRICLLFITLQGTEALEGSKKQTGTKLVNHPFSMKLEIRNFVEFIIAVLQEQARAFTELQRDDGKLIEPVERVVHFLRALYIGTIFQDTVSVWCVRLLL
jgi:hypothetical protein